MVVRVIFILFFAALQFSSATDSTSKGSEVSLTEKYPELVESLFAQLDLNAPVLSLVQKAEASGDREGALELLLIYYRGKYIPPELSPELPPAREDFLKLAEDATEDVFTIQSETFQQPRKEDGSLDWDHLGPKQDKEWAWMMNRHHHFNYLLTAYRETEDSVYLKTISDHLIDWISSHPPPNRLSFSTAWRALEGARRLVDAWLPVFVNVRKDQILSDEALFLMITSIPQHAEYLLEHYSFWGGNHKVTEKMAVAICALIWSEFKDSEKWLNKSVLVIEEELFKQTYPDGSYKELANHYQKVVAENYLRMLQVLTWKARDRIRPETRERIEKVWDYFACVSRPSGFGPLNSDSSLEHNHKLLGDAIEFFERKDWAFIASKGEEGDEPEGSPSRYYPWAGHAIMRSGWDTQAEWAFFDIGPHGSAHQHYDRLHLSVSFGEQDVLVDGGRYFYKPGPFRHYFRHGPGHNIVQVDGRDSKRPPNVIDRPMNLQRLLTKSIDLFEGEVNFPRTAAKDGVRHKRTVIYIRDEGWLVIDRFVGFGAHEYQTHWNLHPGCEVREEGGGLLATWGSGDSAHVQLISGAAGKWSIVKGQMEPEIRGWYSRAYNEREPAYSTRLVQKTLGPHQNIWWIGADVFDDTLMSIRSGEPNGEFELTIQISDGEIEVGEEDGRWRIES